MNRADNMSNNNSSIATRTFKIATYDIGFNNQMKISSIMKYQQDIGDEYLASSGFTHDYLYNEVGVFFAVSHMRIHIFRLPKLDETVQLTTWCTGGGDESKFRRCFRFSSENGETLIESIALLPVIDVNTRRAIRPSRVEAFQVFAYNDLPLSIVNPKKVAKKEEYTHSLSRTIRYSDLDYNGHVNNTVYADIILDSLPKGTETNEIEQLDIYFRAEMKMGQNITVSSVVEGETAYFCGENDGTVCFTAKCDLKN